MYAAHLPEGQIREIEFYFDQVPYLAISFENGNKKKSYTSQSSAAIDFGEIHSIAALKEQGEAILMTGRKVRSLHRLRNKKIAKLRDISRNARGNHDSGSDIKKQNAISCPNQPGNYKMHYIKPPNSLSTGVSNNRFLMSIWEIQKESNATHERKRKPTENKYKNDPTGLLARSKIISPTN